MHQLPVSHGKGPQTVSAVETEAYWPIPTMRHRPWPTVTHQRHSKVFLLRFPWSLSGKSFYGNMQERIRLNPTIINTSCKQLTRPEVMLQQFNKYFKLQHYDTRVSSSHYQSMTINSIECSYIWNSVIQTRICSLSFQMLRHGWLDWNIWRSQGSGVGSNTQQHSTRKPLKLL